MLSYIIAALLGALVGVSIGLWLATKASSPLDDWHDSMPTSGDPEVR
jgi:hypothetical protein